MMKNAAPAENPKLGKLCSVALVALVGLLFLTYAVGWFDDKTPLAPDLGAALDACIVFAAVGAVAGGGLFLWQLSAWSAWRRIAASLAFALASFVILFLLSGECVNVVTGWIDFPPGRTRSFQAPVMISRAYETRGRRRSWNIQTMPWWSNIDITEEDYRFMLAHRPPDDRDGRANEIASKGYFCAQVTLQQSGDALRILHAGRHTLPKGTVIICPQGPGRAARG